MPPTAAARAAAPTSHACAQCASFDPGSRFECMQTIPARVSPKNARNTCALFSAAHDRRARNDDAQGGQPARRSTTCSSSDAAASFGSMPLLSEQDRADRPDASGGLDPRRSRCFLHPDHRRARDGADRQAGPGRGRRASTTDHARRSELRPGQGTRGPVRHRRTFRRSCLLRDGADTRMRFLGAPAGYEFMSLVEASSWPAPTIPGCRIEQGACWGRCRRPSTSWCS